MLKIKLIDFLEFVNFRDTLEIGNKIKESNIIVRIYYPDLENPGEDSYNSDRYFEYGIYDFSHDTRKRIKDTINPRLLDLYVSKISVSAEDNILQIIVVYPEDIEEFDIDRYDNFDEEYSDNIRKIFVSSPLSGNYEENIKRAKTYCRWVALQGNIPLAPHVYYTSFLDDENEEERELGINMGLEWLKDSDEMWVFSEHGISKGMLIEIDRAKELQIPIKYIDSCSILKC